MSGVRTRFAPSPTGYLHIGGARTALFCWLHARKTGGTFVLRIEDTDRERSTEESVQAILDSMEWLGLSHDEGPFFQTKRFDRYAEQIRHLLESGQAYRCYCSREELDEMRTAQMARKEKPRYDGRCRERASAPADTPSVIRFRNPDDGQVVIEDLVHGRVVFNNKELDDLIIERSDGTPTYNLSVVVDDMDMQITHVLRGDDHLNNTPRQVNLFRALGAEPPVFAHVPMILGPDGARLSKRHGAVSVMEYRDRGYLPEALLNYLVRLGWSHGDDEIFSLDELTKCFEVGDINKKASAVNPAKLDWINQHYIKNGNPGRLAEILRWHLDRDGIDCAEGPALESVVAAQQERAKTMAEMAQNSHFFYQEFEEYHDKAARKHLKEAAVVVLRSVREKLEASEAWTPEAIHGVVEATCAEHDLGMGKVAQPIRVAVSGGPISPPIDITLALLGREVTLARLTRALAYILERVVPEA